MCDGFLVVVLWPGPFSKLILLVDGALPLTQFILDCNTANFNNEVDHMMLNLNTENDWNRGFVVVQWPGFVIYMT